MSLCSLCRIISSRSFPIVSNSHIGLYDEASPRGLLPFLSRTNLCFFQSAKNLPSRRQKLKTSRSISGYTPITSLRISFGNPSIPGAVFAFSLPPALFSFSRVKSYSRRTTQELRSCLWNGSTCGNKLRTIYLNRSWLSRRGVFLIVTNLLVTILKVRPHGFFSSSPIKSFQHWSRIFFMPCLRADFAFFHTSRSRGSPFERVNLRRAVRHFLRRTDNWSFHHYIESPVRPCPWRGMEWSHAATTFRLAARTVCSNDPLWGSTRQPDWGILFEAGWDLSLLWNSTPLSRRHLWLLSISLNTSLASLTLSLTWPGLFLSIPCWMTLRALANFSDYLFCSLRSWRTSFHPSASGEAPKSLSAAVVPGVDAKTAACVGVFSASFFSLPVSLVFFAFIL